MITRLSETQEREMIQQVIDGNSHAYRKLVEQYERYVYSAAMKIVGHQEDAEDVAQDTFLKAYKSLAQFDGRSKFSTWLYRIAVNTAISRRRKLKFYTKDIDDTPIKAVSSHNSLKVDEQRKYIQLAFDQMREDDVTILTLFYLKELSLKEMAEILEIEVNSVKVKLHRARKKLAKKIKLILNHETKSLL